MSTDGFQELINHIMKPRDDYFKLIMAADDNAAIRRNQELEYFSNLWEKAKEICRNHGFKYENQAVGSPDPQNTEKVLSQDQRPETNSSNSHQQQ